MKVKPVISGFSLQAKRKKIIAEKPAKKQKGGESSGGAKCAKSDKDDNLFQVCFSFKKSKVYVTIFVQCMVCCDTSWKR